MLFTKKLHHRLLNLSRSVPIFRGIFREIFTDFMNNQLFPRLKSPDSSGKQLYRVLFWTTWLNIENKVLDNSDRLTFSGHGQVRPSLSLFSVMDKFGPHTLAERVAIRSFSRLFRSSRLADQVLSSCSKNSSNIKDFS